ncbi:hypothetical protein OIO07_21915 [Bacillus paralicheniformis]|nr:hypothetical protein [Bacillus paralicheniformis]TWJ83991.1 hypothetical protein CHCC20496_1525 [Bacillus licheniformis]MCV9370880.1 hypothetical protein [Bacillus paralicheniformis]TWJ63634.1 hypothetical protein CHCC5021_2578 [Bacillus paralicheniformis]TWK41864.1 hypothetical protein CHCC20347_2305 [Bacillus paralicheniformis]TWK99473.1 hypothetical protein CHCC20327_4619 [Bacillus licheniformis]
MKKLYTDLMENGYKLHEIDEMDIHRFFELADFKYEEENKLVPAYRIFGVTL